MRRPSLRSHPIKVRYECTCVRRDLRIDLDYKLVRVGASKHALTYSEHGLRLGPALHLPEESFQREHIAFERLKPLG